MLFSRSSIVYTALTADSPFSNLFLRNRSTYIDSRHVTTNYVYLSPYRGVLAQIYSFILSGWHAKGDFKHEDIYLLTIYKMLRVNPIAEHRIVTNSLFPQL